jgi:hypothetical protein
MSPSSTARQRWLAALYRLPARDIAVSEFGVWNRNIPRVRRRWNEVAAKCHNAGKSCEPQTSRLSKARCLPSQQLRRRHPGRPTRPLRALIAGTPWLDVFCPGCGTSRAIDLRKVDRHSLASVATLVLGQGRPPLPAWTIHETVINRSVASGTARLHSPHGRVRRYQPELRIGVHRHPVAHGDLRLCRSGPRSLGMGRPIRLAAKAHF